MSKKLTIILLLKDRDQFNERFINYFFENNLNFNLFISDGSKKKLDTKTLKKIKNNKNISYHYFGEDKSYKIYFKKIYKTLKKIKSEYVLFASNDDFLNYKQIKFCLRFLEKKKDYIGAGGELIGFNLIDKKKLIKMSSLNRIYKYIKLDSNNSINRFENYVKNFSDMTFNCIIKRKLLLNSYKLSSNLFENNIELKDHFNNLFIILSGKIKIFKKPIIFHQNHLNSEGNKRGNLIKSLLMDKNFINYLICFDRVLNRRFKISDNYILKYYYNYVIINYIKGITMKSEPSIKEIKKIFLNKIFKKFRYKKENTNSFEFKYLNNEIKNINNFLK